MVSEYAAAGEPAVGTMVYGGFNVNSENPRVKKFVDNFKKRYKREPSRVAALSYDAYYMLAKGIEKSPSLRPSHVRKSIMGLKDFPGVTGITSMNPNREAVKEPFLFEMAGKDGKYSFVSVKEPL